MNVTVENLAPCKKLIRFEVDSKTVDDTFDSVSKEYLRHAAMPGFRPGKAPREMVLKKYEKEIEEEVKRKLMSEAYHKGIKDQKITVVGYPDVEQIQFARGQAYQFAATLETAPEFEMPEYRGLPAKRAAAIVTEAEIDRALEALRSQLGKFEKVDRPVQQGDFVVVNYTGTSEGKPITEIEPAARGLTEQKNFWVEVKKDSFIPGFAEQLIGAKPGDKRTVTVDFPADFVTPQLAGKQGVYEVEVTEVKERNLPPMDEAFTQSYGAENLEKLREGVRRDLQNELNVKQKRSVRGQIVKSLLDRVNFDLPESIVEQETRTVVYDIVAENQKRGVSKETIDRQKEEIYSMANQGAKERIKTSFLFQRIAEKEGIRVLPEELKARIAVLASSYNMSVDKLTKELEKREGMADVYQQILHEKVVDLLQENARIEHLEPDKVST